MTTIAIDKFRAVVTRFANGVPTRKPLRLAVEYRREHSRPVFLRTIDEQGRSHQPGTFDQTQLFEAYDRHQAEERW